MRCALFLCFLLASAAALLPTPPAAVVSASRRYVPRLAPRGVQCQTDPEEIEQEKPVNDSLMVDDPPMERVCSFPGCDGNGRVLGGVLHTLYAPRSTRSFRLVDRSRCVGSDIVVAD